VHRYGILDHQTANEKGPGPFFRFADL